ncbi:MULTISPECIES: 2-succinyl-6-hydroxy-2,4-cyclohexadiene-1-carboxylate synthase [Planktothricoides]|uniref:Putative 2-succinyl-6-hydroxy-2,4-cyclohexadiene-1-carboxylate synthase n=2 Tax=Planktothricoides raciborskii TaxID=132608 RepID=A0AAU8JGU0_9CYAN|nr:MULTISPECIES: 2-succinyl-6-hydroxy-2,4-cyclohexadiene-1-carboxylate synthase [Planktothricoides]KOR35286.1 alpha/beta hydrolase [Planktothricoides sp. SR001]MBD2543763.1 2-succinyl-6-hydroxy-2,4-cyclohexadiene-1-carboxylate synthase [Planktothricoides raciborskii FACHB-1370]MBD2582342.1 2-succinyl-6-hydroxy-2,4-cyclohexadiene-1-carboxylate synthase [Planktothricoides raciborskii FACHB-1261]
MNIHYSLSGNRHKPVILFLHGFLGSGDDYREICTELKDKFCCLTVDLPGHGKTTVNGDETSYQMPQTAQALISLLDRLHIDQCFLVGYSMGGRLALYLTLHFPQRFYQVILEGASPGLKTEPERSQRRAADEALAQKLETIPFKSFLIEWYHQPLFQSLLQHPDWGKLMARRMQENPRELSKSLRNLGTGNQPSLWEQLPHNSVPILLLVGEYDDKFRKINTEIVQRSAFAQLKIIPHTGHNIHWENSRTYVNELIQFFGACDRLKSC